VVPVDLNDEVSISNGDFDLTIYQIMQIEAKKMADREIRLKDSVKEEVNLYEIQMRYINQTNEASKLSYQQLWISTPEGDSSENSLVVVGYCEPLAENPTGKPAFCAYLPPPPKPGSYGVTGVFQASPVRVEPGEQAEIYFIVIMEKAQTEIEISFVEPE
jgi:hypothetical protein